jgi:hypothetical protein
MEEKSWIHKGGSKERRYKEIEEKDEECDSATVTVLSVLYEVGISQFNIQKYGI